MDHSGEKSGQNQSRRSELMFGLFLADVISSADAFEVVVDRGKSSCELAEKPFADEKVAGAPADKEPEVNETEVGFSRITSSDASPDLVMRHEGTYIAIDFAVTNGRDLRETIVRKAAKADRMRQQMPTGSLVILILHGPFDWPANSIFAMNNGDEVDVASINLKLRSAVIAGQHQAGFDAIILLDDPRQVSLLSLRMGRSFRYEYLSLIDAVSRVLQLKRPEEKKEISSEANFDSYEPQQGEFAEKEINVNERYLLVADELLPAKGGISSFNLELAKALIKHGRQVCIALPEMPSDEEHEEAKRIGLMLAIPERQIPGISGPAALLPGISYIGEKDFSPTVIVGHGRILGPYAYAIQSQKHLSALRIHLVHMHPEELERAKETDGGSPRTQQAAERAALEIELAKSANVVAGVGKKLTGWIEDQVLTDRLFKERGGQVLCIIPGLREWPLMPPRVPTEKRFLVIVRADDFASKGLSTAIHAVGKAKALRPNYKDTISLVIRGVPNAHAEINERATKLASPYNYLPIFREFTTNPDDIEKDLRTAVAVLMPSKTEGFGLSAYEAIAAEIPVLITRESGLARMLRDVDKTDGWSPEALEPYDTDAWTEAILRILDDPVASFNRAGLLMKKIEREDFWASSINQLENALALARR